MAIGAHTRRLDSPACCAAGGGRRDTGSGEDTGDGGRAGANVGAGGGQLVRKTLVRLKEAKVLRIASLLVFPKPG